MRNIKQFITKSLQIGSSKLKLSMVALCLLFVASTSNAQNVTQLGAWTPGITKAVEAGTKRVLVVSVSGELNPSASLTNVLVTYGGQAMTKQLLVNNNNLINFGNFTALFTLNDAGITAATSTDIAVTFESIVEPMAAVASCFYSNVDQLAPVSATSFNATDGGTKVLNLSSPALMVPSGSMAILSTACGDNVLTFTYATGFTEVSKVGPNHLAKTGEFGTGTIATKLGTGVEETPGSTSFKLDLANAQRFTLATIVLKKDGLVPTIEILNNTVSAYIANGELNIVGAVSNQAIVTMFDLSGRAAASFSLNQGSFNSMSIAKLNAGMYIVRIADGAMVQNVKLMVK